MGKCRNCNIEILDVTECCPLCHSILEQTEELENMYPDVRPRMRRLLFVSRLYLFCAILAEAVLVGLNLLFPSEVWWSVITGLGLLGGYIVLRYAIMGTAGHKSKVVILALAVVMAAVIIDFATGYRGWSVDYVAPAGILLVDLILVICMICNRRNWQSYIMWQLLMILFSVVPIVFYAAGLERNPYMAFLPAAASCALFSGTMIIGDRRARTELKRRFHFK